MVSGANAPGWDEAGIAAFEGLVAPLSNWGRWGPDDERGTANLLSAHGCLIALRDAVTTGEVLALGRRLSTRPGPDNPRPLLRHMLGTGEGVSPAGGRHVADWLALAYHGLAVTHLDAPSHAIWSGRIYNGRPADQVTVARGAAVGSVEPLAAGLVGRGILLDAPMAFDVPWLDPGTALGPAELDAVAAACGVRPEPGDMVLVRSGRDARAAATGAFDPVQEGSAGLAAAALAWMREHDVGVLGSDAASDAMRAGGAPHPMPIHAGALVFLGMPLLDNLWLEELAVACERRRSWSFLLAVAPLRLSGATGSPVNPTAVL